MSRSWFQLNKLTSPKAGGLADSRGSLPPPPHPRELSSQHVAGDLPSVHAPDRDVDGSPATFKIPRIGLALLPDCPDLTGYHPWSSDTRGVSRHHDRAVGATHYPPQARHGSSCMAP
jgi:hypothetical protein